MDQEMVSGYHHVSICPRCGAPIYERIDMPPMSWDDAQRDPRGVVLFRMPTAHFTCECRLSLPSIPSGELAAPKSVSQADAEFVDRMRDSNRGKPESD